MALPHLISCDWLHNKLESGSHRTEKIVVVDVSWSSSRKCEEDFKQEHITDAVYIDVLAADHSDMYPRNIPSPEAFTKAAQQAGIDSDSKIIVYSNSDRAGYFLAGRGWWTFRYFGHKNVSILDGGLLKWKQMGFPTTNKSSQRTMGNFVARVDKTINTSYAEVKENTNTQTFQVLDSRPDTAYNDNHIPGAKNLLMGNIVDNEKGTLKSKEELQQLFTKAGIDLEQPLATHCNSGMSSCAVAFTAEYLGAKDVSVFHGGFTEWKNKQEQ